VREIEKTNDSTHNVRFATTYVGRKCSGGLLHNEKKGFNVREAVQKDDPSFDPKGDAGAFLETGGVKFGKMDIIPA
jgi:hypothetical protein